MTDLLDKLIETLLEITGRKTISRGLGIKEVEQLKEKCVHEYEWHHVEVSEDMQSICICNHLC